LAPVAPEKLRENLVLERRKRSGFPVGVSPGSALLLKLPQHAAPQFSAGGMWCRHPFEWGGASGGHARLPVARMAGL